MTSFNSIPHVSGRTANAMMAAGIGSVEAIIDMSDNELIRLPNVGPKSLMELRLAKLVVQNSMLQADTLDPLARDVDTDLRDHIAVKVLESFLHPDGEMPSIGDCTKQDLLWWAQDAYKVADAMLEARK